jgi:ferric-dicitrate binding protein FerR (iron transport regulator)
MEEKQYTYIEDLIVKYLSGGLDAISLQELQNWISASPKNRDYFIKQQEIWFTSYCVKENFSFNKEEAFVKFQNRIKKLEETEIPVFSFKKILNRAAVVALFFGVSYASYWQGGRHLKSHLANMIVVEAPLGSKVKMYLPDSTLVWLNAGSKITYFQDFGIVSRDVEMVGEAYFEVTKNKEVPFNVKSKDLSVQVLGTKFDFRNYADDKEVMVALLEGKVSFANQLKRTPVGYLSPNEKVVLDKKSGNAIVSSIRATNASEWTNGYLFFDEKLLPDITRELERSYNVKIDITNESLKSYRFYGDFVQRELTINEILDILVLTRKIQYTIKNKNHIIIY